MKYMLYSMRWVLLAVAGLVAVGMLFRAVSILSGQTPASALKIIREKCLQCHSGEKPPNGLRLDSVDNMVRGGKSGPAVVPFYPDKSLVYLFVIPRDGAGPRMPPIHPLEESEQATIRRWIQQGAHQFTMGANEP